ncbi:hypothetical protein ES703_104092 [subsurface metagenome]
MFGFLINSIILNKQLSSLTRSFNLFSAFKICLLKMTTTIPINKIKTARKIFSIRLLKNISNPLKMGKKMSNPERKIGTTKPLFFHQRHAKIIGI